MNLYAQSIEARIDWLFAHAKKHAESFASPETWLARKRYLAEHPTAIGVLKCMDGRINIPVATETPMGIIQPFRNLGGRFDLGWPHLGEVLSDYVMSVVREGRRVLLTSTYHFSKGDPHRGYAGFNYDTEAARAHTFAIRSQIEQVYGAGHQTVYPLVCGFETDDDALILHGQNGDVLDASTVTGIETLPVRLQTLFPDMPEQMRADLLPLVQGNIRHIAEVRQTARELDIEHREWMICLGRGFDWLHMPNQALIIGPYSPDLDDPVRKAAGILQSNMVAGRPDDGFLLLVSVPYAEIGVDRARRTKVALPLRLRSRSHHARVSTAGRKNAPQNGRVELGQPKSGIAGERLRVDEVRTRPGRIRMPGTGQVPSFSYRQITKTERQQHPGQQTSAIAS